MSKSIASSGLLIFYLQSVLVLVHFRNKFKCASSSWNLETAETFSSSNLTPTKSGILNFGRRILSQTLYRSLIKTILTKECKGKGKILWKYRICHGIVSHQQSQKRHVFIKSLHIILFTTHFLSSWMNQLSNLLTFLPLKS